MSPLLKQKSISIFRSLHSIEIEKALVANSLFFGFCVFRFLWVLCFSIFMGFCLCYLPGCLVVRLAVVAHLVGEGQSFLGVVLVLAQVEALELSC